MVDASKNKLFFLCVMGTFIGSIIFCLFSSGIWQTGFWLLLSLLSLATIVWLYRTMMLWKHSAAKTKSLILLLAVLLTEYWLWLFFATYPAYSSYVFLLTIEFLRFLTLLFILRYLFGFGGINSAWNIFMFKFFLMDFIIILTSRITGVPGKTVWERMDLFHTLNKVSLFLLFWIQISLTAYYIVLYRKKSVTQTK